MPVFASGGAVQRGQTRVAINDSWETGRFADLRLDRRYTIVSFALLEHPYPTYPGAPMEIIGPSSNVQSNESGAKITLQSIEASESAGIPKGWKSAHRGLFVLLLALGIQTLACLGMIVAGAIGNDSLGTYTAFGVAGAQALVAIGLLQVGAVAARDLRVLALLAALLWAGATAVGAFLAPTGFGWYVLALLLFVGALGVWAFALRGIGFRFEAESLGRDALFLWGIVIAGAIYGILLASPESRVSFVENGVFGGVVAIWHGLLILQARKAIAEGD